MKKIVNLFFLIFVTLDTWGQIITTVAGNGFQGYSGDGVLATNASLLNLNGIAIDEGGNIYFTEKDRIRKVNSATGIITTIAGNGTSGYSGDGGLATAAQLNSPLWITFDRNENLYIADGGNNVIRKVNSVTGIITTVAGNGTSGFSGDGGLATAAQLHLNLIVSPRNNIIDGGVAVDRNGNIYIADAHNSRIRKVNSSTGIITTVAGNDTSVYSIDGELAINTLLYYPTGISVDTIGNIYIVQHQRDAIRKVNSSTGIITTVVGTGFWGYSGDGGLATAAQLKSPGGVSVDKSGNIYIADRGNNRIRKVTNSASSITKPYNLNTLLIAPNPFNNYTTIKLPITVYNAEIIISDLLGKRIQTKKFSGKEYLLEKGTICPGDYFIQINDNQNNCFTTKIAIQ